jgi:hypothetical protein
MHLARAAPHRHRHAHTKNPKPSANWVAQVIRLDQLSTISSLLLAVNDAVVVGGGRLKESWSLVVGRKVGGW